MQKLSGRRLTDTPWDIPHVPCNCGASLNSPEGRDSVARLTTPDNNPDAALTPKGENMQVYVLNHKGKPLMPCSPRKARLLLKTGRVKVLTRTPLTIQWRVPTRSFHQPVILGVDSGYTHIGLSAVSDEKELYASDVLLRTDIVKLNSERRQYRGARRHRKTWHRQPRFNNRRTPEGWLAPSIQHKLNSHIKIIGQVNRILPVSEIVVEVAAFDIQKIKNPDISGADYQNGPQKDFWNVREYVLYRDDHICQHCRGKSKNPVLEVHHLQSRQTSGDRPDNLITLCKTCHDKVSIGNLKLRARPSNGFKAETFMSMVRWRLVNTLRDLRLNVRHTYGYLTKCKRIELGLPKSHTNDAFVIAGGSMQSPTDTHYLCRQVRKCNRKLFKGDRSHIKNTAPRFIHGFQRYDKVLYDNTECFIFGRRSSGYFDLRTLDGTKVHASAKYSQCSLIQRAKTLLIQQGGWLLIPALKCGVSEA